MIGISAYCVGINTLTFAGLNMKLNKELFIDDFGPSFEAACDFINKLLDCARVIDHDNLYLMKNDMADEGLTHYLIED